MLVKLEYVDEIQVVLKFPKFIIVLFSNNINFFYEKSFIFEKIYNDA